MHSREPDRETSLGRLETLHMSAIVKPSRARGHMPIEEENNINNFVPKIDKPR